MLENLNKELQKKVLLKHSIVTSDKYSKDIYENSFYTVEEINNKWGYSYNCTTKDKYIPDIYIKSNLDDNSLIDFISIQTTSYGTMEVEEIEKVIKGYQIAVETVKQLKEIFNLK